MTDQNQYARTASALTYWASLQAHKEGGILIWIWKKRKHKWKINFHLKQEFSIWGSWPFWGVYIRYSAYQVFTLWLITVERFQLWHKKVTSWLGVATVQGTLLKIQSIRRIKNHWHKRSCSSHLKTNKQKQANKLYSHMWISMMCDYTHVITHMQQILCYPFSLHLHITNNF